MRYLSAAIFTIFICLSTVVYSQKIDKKAEKKALKEANLEYLDEKYPLALPYYLEAYRVNPKNPLTNYRTGICEAECRNHGEAIKYLVSAYKLDPGVDPEILYHLGSAYHHTEQFDDAIESFKKYQKSSKGGFYLDAIERRIEECEVGKELVADPIDVKIENVGPRINSSGQEYAPVVSADELVMVFTSRREGSTGGMLDHTGTHYEDIYVSEKVDGEWQEPVNLKEINTAVHDASVGLSPDATELIVFKAEGMGDLYSCKKNKDGTWVKPQKFPKQISAKSSYEPSGTISRDGVLFFASNREGGYGGMDLYKSQPDGKGGWENPTNLGGTINTEYNEDAPFIDIDGVTLYFSSEGHRTMGEHDIFKAVYNGDSDLWSEPENLGYPINSTEDDIYFVLSGDGSSAYFNSVKEGGYGGEDIYRMTFTERVDRAERLELVEEITGTKLAPFPTGALDPNVESVTLNGVIYDESTTEVINDAEVIIKDTQGKELQRVLTTDKGSYAIILPKGEFGKFELLVSKKGYRGHSKNVFVPEALVQEKKLVTDFYLFGNGESAGNASKPEAPVESTSIENNTSNTNEKVEAILDLFPVRVTGVINDRSNQTPLSDAIVTLVDKSGRAVEKFTVGSDGVFEFAVPVDQSGVFSVSGESDSYLYQSRNISVPKATEEKQVVDVKLALSKPVNNAKIVLRNVYFEFNDYKLMSTSHRELDKVVALMKDKPNATAEVGSHTDYLGSDQYNLTLSKKRSQAVVNYLVSKGVAESRLSPVGYGESRPLASNDDEEEGRQLNRRTEFIIKGL